MDAAIVATAVELRRCNPRLWVQSGQRSTEAQPFEAWAEFKRVEDPGRIEDVVIFLSVKLDGDGYTGMVDISTGEGVVLVDGPTLSAAADASGVWRERVLNYVAAVERFLHEHHGLLREALC